MTETTENVTEEDATAKTRLARLVLGIIMPAALLAIGVVPFLFARGSLPNPVATHFEFNGTANGSMDQWVSFAIDATMMLAGVGMLVYVTMQRRPMTTGAAPLLAAMGGLVAGLGAAISSSTAWTQQNVAQWQDVRLSQWWSLWILGLAIVAATIGALLAAELPSSGREDVTPVAPLDLAPTERSVWTSTLSLPWMTAGAIAVLALAGVFLLTAPGIVTIVAVIIGISMLTFSRIRVRADEDGLHIQYGLLGLPSTHITIDEIEQASAIDVRPMEWGGWGYRGSLKLLQRAAVVLRAGAGIRLDLDGDRTFVVTVDRPETAAALLNAYVGRRTPV